MWQPDLIVCDEIDFGSMVAAERLGLPYATVLVTAAGSFVRHELVAEPLNALRLEHGLPPDPELAMLSRYLILSPASSTLLRRSEHRYLKTVPGGCDAKRWACRWITSRQYSSSTNPDGSWPFLSMTATVVP